MITSTWKLVVLGCAMIIVLVAANATVTSHAREHTVTQQSFRSELPAAFNTNPMTRMRLPPRYVLEGSVQRGQSASRRYVCLCK